MSVEATGDAPSFVVSPEVRAAVDADRPVVALESTIFTHGLPRPRNLQVALEAEQQLREAGVVPATIGVADGVATVGLSSEQITRLCGGDSACKISLRDLPMTAAKRLSGGTTVAATAFLAHKAGVRVFATGGIGGVHRGAAATFDESADLPVLSATPILVVCAGVKSILDISASLERLETLSISVVGYRTTRFPGFYIVDSGYAIEFSIDNAAEAARLVRARDELGATTAIVVANPVPEESQLSSAEHELVLASALQAAATVGIVGPDSTPFMLDYFQKATDGRSLDVNVAVYRNNVRLAGEIAVCLTN